MEKNSYSEDLRLENTLREQIACLEINDSLINKAIELGELGGIIGQEFFRQLKKIMQLILQEHWLSEDELIGFIDVFNRFLIILNEEKNIQSPLLAQLEETKRINKMLMSTVDRLSTEAYNLWAEYFDSLYFYSEKYITQKEFKEIIGFLKRRIRGKTTNNLVLDVGSGTGFPGLGIARILENTQVYCMEKAPRMIIKAKEFQEQKRWIPNITAQHWLKEP